MFEISEALSWQVRKQRAYRRMTTTEAAAEIGISRQTLRKIESGELKKTKKTIFIKLTNWLMREEVI